MSHMHKGYSAGHKEPAIVSVSSDAPEILLNHLLLEAGCNHTKLVFSLSTV